MSEYVCPYAVKDKVKDWHLKVCRSCDIDGFTCPHWNNPEIASKCPTKRQRETNNEN